MKNLTKLFVVMFLMLTAVLAQKQDYSKHQGYVDFTQLEKFKMDDGVTEVIVEEKLLRMIGKMAKSEDPELQDVLNKIKLVKAISFKVDNNNVKEMNSKITNIAQKLDGMGWDRIVKSKGSNKSAYVYIKTKGEDDVLGVAVLAIEDSGEATFVNLVGDINMDAVGRLSSKLNIPALGMIKGKNSK